MPRRTALSLLACAIAMGLASSPSTGVASERAPLPGPAAVASPTRAWGWPVWPFRLVEAYAQPADRYAAGHRGIDLRPLDGGDVRSPADGFVAFAGRVAGRPLVTIDHGDGLVTTLEPVLATLASGARVTRGDVVGVLDTGGHAAVGTLHFGVRLWGEYLNPLTVYGEVPRAVLLPCCE